MKNLKINWKTTVSGGIVLFCFLAHILSPAIFTGEVTAGIVTVATSFGLLTAKDGDVTGIGTTATTEVSQALPVLDSLTSHSNNPTMQDVHLVIDKLSTAFVAAAQANAAAVPAVAPSAIPEQPSQPPADITNTVITAPAVDANSDVFQQAVESAVAAKLAQQTPPAV